MVYQELDKKIQDLVLQDKFSGCINISKYGQPIFSKAYSFASKAYKVKNEIDTRFNIASAGKSITSVAILQLVQENKLSLSDMIDKYIGDLINDNIKGKITIQHLLTHTSGLGDYFDRINTSTYQNEYNEFNDFKAIIKDSVISFEPGENWSYSNLGYLLLGFIIQNVTGVSYYQYIKENIFDLIGMKDSVFWFYDEPIKNSATGYYYDYNHLIWRCYVNKPCTRGTSSGGCFSTVKDLTIFLNAFMNGDLINNKLVKEAISAKSELSSSFYGYGFFIDDDKISHSGNGTGVSSKMIYYKNGVSVVVLSNYGNGVEEVEKLIDFL